MKKWGWLALIVFSFLIWQAWSIYGEAMAPKRSMAEKAFARAEEAVGLVDVKKVYTYYGEEACTVFIGQTKQGETDIVVWVPEKEGDIVVKRADSGISEAEARAILQRDRHPQQVIDATLGMEKGVPLWELTYIDAEGRYSFYYLHFADGAFLKRYSFQR
ncbi:cell wall elongation regulator TseB-like domain-containing protein [Geobacillus subterraneus]|uniref:cell wall elongation regulator TseB-like domain-containing protein n=1 Tax=Geobacillus subterraneus TaxID=129338 RepID=UPI00160A9F7B